MMHWRWMIRRDLEEVYEIERLCFEFPWDEDMFTSWQRKRNCISCVVEDNVSVLGFVVYELHRLRIDIVNIAVLPRVQRNGVGRLIIDRLRGKLSANRRTRLVAEVRESNVDAQVFFRAMGFRAVAIEREHFENDEDTYRFEYRLPQEALVSAGS